MKYQIKKFWRTQVERVHRPPVGREPSTQNTAGTR